MVQIIETDPRYIFACVFLEHIDPVGPEASPGGHTSLSIVKMLPGHSKRVVNATLKDTLKQIFDVVEEWDSLQIEKANAILSAHGATTVAEARRLFSTKPPRI